MNWRWSGVVLAMVSATQPAAGDTNGINAAAIYAPVFSNIVTWTAANTNIVLSGTNFASPEATAAYRSLAPQVDGLAAAGQATFCDWGTKYEDGAAALLPYVMPARKAAQAAQWVAGYEAAHGLPAAAAHAVEALRLSRNVGEDRLLISYLVQIAGEKRGLEFLAGLAGTMDPAALDTLERSMASLPPGTTLVETLQMEKAMFVDNLIKTVLEAMRTADTNLFAVVTDGGAGGTNGTAGTETPAAASGQRCWLVDNLRLTSIVESGGRCRMGFETRDGDSFQLSLGRPQRGIELLSADFDREEAVLARSNETALVKLKSRAITALRLEFRLPAPGEMKPGAAGNLLAVLGMLEESLEGKAEFGKRGGRSAVAVLGLLQKMSEEYGEWIAAFQRLPAAEFRAWQDAFLRNVSPITKQWLPAVDKASEREKELFAAREKLAAAIAVRRAQLR